MMNENNTKNVFQGRRILRSLIWKFAERCGAQISSFVVSMILARILLPEEYGLLSILLIFITLSQVIVQSGLGTALIQRKQVDNRDYSSVFYVSIALSIVLYSILFVTAPYIALFFKMPMITPTLRVMSISLFFGAAQTVLNSKLVKEMKFNKLFVCNITASVVSGISGIFLALNGFGVWSLVVQNIANQGIALLMMCIVTRWIPSGISSIKNVKPLFKYGYKILIANLISTGYNELRSLVVGKKYSGATLAYYDKGKQFPQIIITNLNTTIDNVMLPVYSEAQNDQAKLKQMLSRSIRISSFLLFPIILGLCAVAKPLVLVVLTEKWLPCVPFLIVLSLTYLMTPLQTANQQVVAAMGRSDMFLKLEVIKKTIGIFVLVFSLVLFDDAIYVAYGGLLNAVISSMISMYPNSKMIKYSLVDQVSDIIPALASSLIMACVVWSLSLFIHNIHLLLVSQTVLGIAVYIFVSLIIQNSSFRYILGMIKKR